MKTKDALNIFKRILFYCNYLLLGVLIFYVFSSYQDAAKTVKPVELNFLKQQIAKSNAKLPWYLNNDIALTLGVYMSHNLKTAKIENGVVVATTKTGETVSINPKSPTTAIGDSKLMLKTMGFNYIDQIGNIVAALFVILCLEIITKILFFIFGFSPAKE